MKNTVGCNYTQLTYNLEVFVNLWVTWLVCRFVWNWREDLSRFIHCNMKIKNKKPLEQLLKHSVTALQSDSKITVAKSRLFTQRVKKKAQASAPFGEVLALNLDEVSMVISQNTIRNQSISHHKRLLRLCCTLRSHYEVVFSLVVEVVWRFGFAMTEHSSIMLIAATQRRKQLLVEWLYHPVIWWFETSRCTTEQHQFENVSLVGNPA